ncbi:MAG TPA: radical SAM protein [Micromonosporaceae bacterium]|nr:radical SAM protein [Micromonosporaceae bacterium]HCU51378.1 radical SAM protein [Micromonosporaceae bacterium]
MKVAEAAIRQVLLKVHSRCNLSCDYCYIYTFEDQSWRDQPVCMSRGTIDLAATRIAEHAARHRLPFLHLILHGGEPLLAGTSLLDYLVSTVRAAVPPETRILTGIQTNGLLLDDDFLALFQKHRIKVGISLDGGPQAHDRHRKFANGRGSYASVSRALERLREFPDLYGGILTTVDLHNDPAQLYSDLLHFAPPKLDFLLPHGNWSTPPPGRTFDQTENPYGDWLITIFDRWYDAPRRRTSIRLFESVMSLLMGGPSGSEAVGLDPVDLLTIETDGSIEQVDVLKTAGPGMAATGLHIASHSFDDALLHPGVRARMNGLADLAVQCRQCPLVRVCGGGLYAHRYREGAGFGHPSVYCPDLTALITHIRDRMVGDLQACRRQCTV